MIFSVREARPRRVIARCEYSRENFEPRAVLPVRFFRTRKEERIVLSDSQLFQEEMT